MATVSTCLFTVATVDAACAELDVDVQIGVDIAGSSCEGFTGTLQDQGGDDAVDSDCDPDTGLTTCRQDLVADDLTIDCGFVPPGVVFCRTPGFWGARAGGDTKKDGSQKGFDYTGAVIDAAGGCLEVCGQDICGTYDLIGSLGSATEAICMRSNDPTQLNQTYRQAVASALNAVVSTGSGNPDTIAAFLNSQLGEPGFWEACMAACASPDAAVPGTAEAMLLNDCYPRFDCFNNGGQWVDMGGGIGYCGYVGDCVDAAGNVLPDVCSDENDCPEGYECVGNCHIENFCNTPFYEDGWLDMNPWFSCPDASLGPASGSQTCNAANRNDCSISNSILEPGSCDPNVCEFICEEPDF
jgi:hypothetical protein